MRNRMNSVPTPAWQSLDIYQRLWSFRARVVKTCLKWRLAMAGYFALPAALLLAGASPLQADQGSQGTEAPVPDASDSEEIPVDEFQLDRDRYERLTVAVMIDGKGPFRFFIDTGAQSTVVTNSVTDALKLEPNGSATLVAMGSSRTVETVELDGLEFADRSFSGLVTPLLQSQHIGADGILGLDSLQDLRVAMDFKEDRIAVADAEALGGNRGYDIIVRARNKLGRMIIADAKVDGIRTAVIIDTGAQYSFGNPALLKRMERRLRMRDRNELLTSDVHGQMMRSNLSRAREIVIGGATITQAQIGFADSPAFHALGYTDQPALILGMHNLALFERVAIDFSSRRILFDLPPDASSRSLLQKRFFPSRFGG